ncbi:Regulatory protein TetR [Burkholderiales bacterium]|nr:Regulatory protein TetR [Burkholderiales bacterium]
MSREDWSKPANAILDVAERLAQTRGYNGFSYADIAAKLGVTKASLHYHFASKEELGRALIGRYHKGFGSALASIDGKTVDPSRKLRRYVALYDAVIRDDRMCLCGMLAAEYATLPASMQEGLKQFFDLNERWLTAVLQEGRRSGSIKFKEAPSARARVIVGTLEGAMLVARSYGDARRFHAAAQHLLADCSARKGLRRAEPT